MSSIHLILQIRALVKAAQHQHVIITMVRVNICTLYVILRKWQERRKSSNHFPKQIYLTDDPIKAHILSPPLKVHASTTHPSSDDQASCRTCWLVVVDLDVGLGRQVTASKSLCRSVLSRLWLQKFGATHYVYSFLV